MFSLKSYLIFGFILCAGCTSLTIEEMESVTWGQSDEKDTSVQDFTIKFDPNMIEDLKSRLGNDFRTFTPPLNGSAFNYGFNTNNLNIWLSYWRNDYNFTEREIFLNQFPQYTTVIQGLKIHFIWVKPNVTSDVQVIKLLLLHGWPGSVREFYKAIPLLTAVDADRPFAIEVIAPSIPGFGFSEASSLMGLGATEMAVVFKLLMDRLDCDNFYIQGGDWGAVIGSLIATLYPEKVLGYHTNFAMSANPLTYSTWLVGAMYPSLVVASDVVDRAYPISSILKWLTTEMGYLHLMATKPDSIGVAMSDSPAGLLAYILQLISSGSRRENVNKDDGGLLEIYTRDELLDNIMLYWATNSFTTSARIYAESLNMRNLDAGTSALPTTVPTWTVHTKNEIIYQSPQMLQYKYSCLLNSTIYDDYGHFFAFEQPEIYAENVLTALAAFIDYHEKNDA